MELTPEHLKTGLLTTVGATLVTVAGFIWKGARRYQSVESLLEEHTRRLDAVDKKLDLILEALLEKRVA